VSRQGFYQRRQRQGHRAVRDEQVLVQVQAVRTRLPRLGTRKLGHKIAPHLRVAGIRCGRDALFTLLRHRRLLVAKKRSYTQTTDSNHRFRKHPNLVKEAPKPTAPNQLWVSDITYLPTRQGTVYLSLVTDAFSRRVVGHHVHSSLHTTGCLAALDRAVRGAGRAATGCIHHSDRGSQYASDAYQAALEKAKLRCSMTDGYDCYQNALAERVNGILKDEFLFVLPDDLAQARLLVDQAVHLYNEERPHLALNYLTPNQVHLQGKSPAGKSEQGPCLITVNV
jgi:transposase InsO family protein